jgi:hypothetical protein
MTQFFQSFADDGTLQFDASAATFSLIGSGTVSCTDSFAVFSGLYIGAVYNSFGVPIPVAATGCELVGLRCTTAYCFPELTTDGFYVYTQPCTYTDLDWPTSERTNLSSHTVEWWAYKSMRSITPPSSGVGVQLINADGTLAWDSSLKPLRVEDSFTWTASTHGGTTQSFSAPGRIALFAGGTGFRYKTPVSTTLRTGWNPGIKMIGSNISIRDVAVSGYGPAPATFFENRTIMSGVI